MIIKLLIIMLIGAICGLLGAYAGAIGTSKLWRRIGIPLVLVALVYLNLRNLATISLILMFIPLAQGYGIPCFNDKGSLIGRFWYKLIKKYADFLSEYDTQKYASILTRGTIAKIINITAISIPIIKGNWLIYILCSIGIILVYTGLSWRGLGSFRFLGKDLNFSEFYTYLAIGLGVAIITIF